MVSIEGMFEREREVPVFKVAYWESRCFQTGLFLRPETFKCYLCLCLDAERDSMKLHLSLICNQLILPNEEVYVSKH